MKRLQGKSALITGGNAGIGRAAALLFAQEGACVTIAARRAPEGEKVVEEIRRSGGSALFVQTDVSVASECQRAVEKTVEVFGKLDIAFNNAGVEQFGTNIVDLAEEEWDRVLSINLKGVFLCLKYQIPQMLKAGAGSIINTSSVGGLVATPGLAAYQSSKHAVVGLSKVAALECARHNIRVNALCPGGTTTDMFNHWLTFPGMAEKLLGAHPMGRFADPIEPARAALFLASDDASFITGVALPVDGGFVVP